MNICKTTNSKLHYKIKNICLYIKIVDTERHLAIVDKIFIVYEETFHLNPHKNIACLISMRHSINDGSTDSST